MLLSRLKFRPTFWPTVITVPMVLVMIGLSLWQVERLQWKEGLIADRQARIAAEPVALPASGSDLGNIEYRRVAVTGQYLNDREMYLAARSMNGNVGYHIVTPFALTSGGVVLIDRGWVPEEKKLSESRAESLLNGDQTVDGVIRLSQRQAWMQPDNEPEKNVWFFIDLSAMAKMLSAKQADLAVRTDVYLDAGPAPVPGGYPLGGQTHINLPNDHLQYAITWALLAAALIVIYVTYHLQQQRGRK